MGTRSIIGIPDGDGFRGRYAHWDGYPSWMGQQLHALVQRDGVDAVRTMLTETHTGWSVIDSTMAAGKEGQSGPIEPGWGSYYDEQDVGWIEHTDQDAWDIEWAYVLRDDRITVHQPTGSPRRRRFEYMQVGEIMHDRDYAEDDLLVIECGAGFERCKHVVDAHIEDTGCGHMAMTIYLGIEPRGWNEKTAVVIGGGRVELGGSGSTGTARSRRWDPDALVRYWWNSAKNGDGSENDIRIAKILKNGYRLDHDTILAATRDEPELIVAAGTVITH